MKINIADLAEYVGAKPEEISERRFQLLYAETVALITAYAPKLAEVDQWPDAAISVALRIMGRALNAEMRGFTGVTQMSEGAGEFSQSLTFDQNANSGALYLTKQDKLLLRGFAGQSAYSVYLGQAFQPPKPPDWWDYAF